MLEKIRDVAIYLRKSRKVDGLNDTESLQNHRDTLTRLALKHSWKYEVFEEVGSSMDMEVRSEIKKLLDRVESGDFDAVVVMDQDRLSRDRYDSAIIRKVLLDNNTLIVTADENVIDLRDDSDSLMTDFKDIFANYEYKQISKRLSRGKEAAARKGKWVSGRVPLGYKLNKETKMLEIDESEAGIVREIFRLYSEGIGTSTMAIDLNQRGYRGRTGRAFDPKTIQNVLLNEIYVGKVTMRKYRKDGKSYKVRDTEEHIVHNGIYPSLIPQDLWDTVQKIYSSRKFKSPKTRARTHGLTGLIKCGYCGKFHNIQYRKLKRSVSRIVKGCHKKDLLTGEVCRNSGMKYDEFFKGIMFEVSKHRDALEKEIHTVSSDTSEYLNRKAQESSRLKSELSRVERQLERINYMFINDMMSPVELEKEKPSRLKEKEIIIDKIKTLEEETEGDNLNELRETLKRLDNLLLSHNDMEEYSLNDLFSSVIKEIQLFNYKGKDLEPRVDIHWKDKSIE